MRDLVRVGHRPGSSDGLLPDVVVRVRVSCAWSQSGCQSAVAVTPGSPSRSCGRRRRRRSPAGSPDRCRRDRALRVGALGPHDAGRGRHARSRPRRSLATSRYSTSDPFGQARDVVVDRERRAVVGAERGPLGVPGQPPGRGHLGEPIVLHGAADLGPAAEVGAAAGRPGETARGAPAPASARRSAFQTETPIARHADLHPAVAPRAAQRCRSRRPAGRASARCRCRSRRSWSRSSCSRPRGTRDRRRGLIRLNA